MVVWMAVGGGGGGGGGTQEAKFLFLPASHSFFSSSFSLSPSLYLSVIGICPWYSLNSPYLLFLLGALRARVRSEGEEKEQPVMACGMGEKEGETFELDQDQTSTGAMEMFCTIDFFIYKEEMGISLGEQKTQGTVMVVHLERQVLRTITSTLNPDRKSGV